MRQGLVCLLCAFALALSNTRYVDRESLSNLSENADCSICTLVAVGKGKVALFRPNHSRDSQEWILVPIVFIQSFACAPFAAG